MQRTASVLLASLVAGLLMAGCPDKTVEKEEPAALPKVLHHHATDDKAAEDEHGDETDEHGDEPKDDKKPLQRRHVVKKEQAGDEKDQGGW
jgi:hypothetical protein